MRSKWMRMAQIVFAVLVVVFASIAISKRWDMIRDRVATISVDWISLIEASLLVFLAYAVLVETWRRVLRRGTRSYPGGPPRAYGSRQASASTFPGICGLLRRLASWPGKPGRRRSRPPGRRSS